MKDTEDEELAAFRDNAIEHAVRALDDIGFSRVLEKRLATAGEDPLTEKDSIFAGNLLDPHSGKLVAGRNAWEAAGTALARHIAASEAIREHIQIM